MIYSGPDQRTESRAIVGGMSCPRPACRGPVHDPNITAEQYRERDNMPHEHRAFQCMDNKCGWSSGRVSPMKSAYGY